MKTFGIRISVVVVCILFFHLNSLAQISCSPPSDSQCDDKCGGVSIGLSTDENSVFCQSENVTLQIDPSKTSDFDSFYVYWCDGAIGRYGKNDFTYTHPYNIPEDEICKRKETEYFIWVRGKKYCSEGASCRLIGVNLKIKHAPRAKFTASQEVCIDKLATFQSQSCNVDENDPNAYVWDFGDGTIIAGMNPNPTHKYTSTGQYAVKLTVSNGCGSHTSVPQTINIVDLPNAIFDLSANAKDSIVCLGETITLIDKSNIWAVNNIWSFPDNRNPHTYKTNWQVPAILLKRDSLSIGIKDSIHYVDTLSIIMKNKGTYIFKLTSTNVCGTKFLEFPCEVVEAPTINLQTPPEYCETAIYNPSASITGEVYSYLWTFPGGFPSSSTLKTPGTITYNSSGNFLVTLRVIAPCDTIIRTTTVVVNSKSPVNIIDPQKVFCKSSSPDTLKVDRLGGTWAGPGIINSQLGVFDPSNLVAGNYRIIYSIGPTNCKSEDTINIQVVNSETVEVLPLTLCAAPAISASV